MKPINISESLKVFDIKEGLLIYNKNTKESHKIGKAESCVFNAIDGKRSLEEISEISEMRIENLKTLVNIFEKKSLLESNKKENKKKGNIFFSKRGLFYDDSCLDVFSKGFLSLIFNITVNFSIIIFIAIVIYMRGKIDTTSIISRVDIWDILIMDLIMVISISIHEIAHAISSKNNGAFVGEIGVKFDFFLPLAYTTICGIDEVNSKYKKMQIFLAGISFNALLGSFSLIMMMGPRFNNSLVFFMIFSVNICIIILNCITHFKTDMYFMIAYFLEDINIKENSIKMLKGKKRMSLKNYIYIAVTYVLEPAILVWIVIETIRKLG